LPLHELAVYPDKRVTEALTLRGVDPYGPDHRKAWLEIRRERRRLKKAFRLRGKVSQRDYARRIRAPHLHRYSATPLGHCDVLRAFDFALGMI
jgi:hypothetical protein